MKQKRRNVKEDSLFPALGIFRAPGFSSSFVGRLKSNTFYISSCSTFEYVTFSLCLVNKLDLDILI